MRLRDMVSILERELPKLRFAWSQKVQHGLEGYDATALDGIRTAALALSKIAPLNEPALSLLSLPFSNNLLDQLWLPKAEAEPLMARINALITTANLLLAALKQTLPEDSPLSLSLQLPSDLKTTKDLQDVLSDTHIGLEHVLQVLLGEGIEFGGFDVGTDWIVWIMLSEAAVQTILGLWWAVLKLQQEKATLDQMRERVTAVALANKHVASIDEAMNEILAHTKAAVVKELLSKHAPKKVGDNEVTAKVMAALDALSRMRARGARLVPSLTAPKAVHERMEKIESGAAELPEPPSPPQLLPANPEGNES